MLNKTPLLHQSFGPRVSLSLSQANFVWSAEAHWAHFLARASKTLSRRCSVLSPHREGAWGLCEQSKPRAGALLAFCINQGISSVQFSRSVVSDSFRPHESQHARPPCPSLTPGVNSDSCPSSWWCHPTISSSVVPFSSCLQSFPASGSFPMSQFFASGGQSIGSFSFSITLSNEYSGLISFGINWFDLLAVQGTLKSHL